MIQKSNIGSTGVNKIRVPNKQNPNRFVGHGTDHNLIMSEEDKEANEYETLKKLILQYEELGRRQMYFLQEKIIKNNHLADGIIDPKDYIKDKSEISGELSMLGDEDPQHDLEFYPLIPKIVNTLTSFLSKSKVGYSAQAVNREAQNEILELKNNDVRNLLVTKAQEIYNQNLEGQGITQETQPDVYQKQMEIFQALPKVQKYYGTEFRLTVENWANHKLQIAKRKHSIAQLEKELFRNRIICDRPFIHTNLLDDSVRPEVLRPENCAFLRSPYCEDVSEGYMFMWYEYDSPVNLIQRFGDQMDEEDVSKLSMRFTPTRFTASTAANTQFDNKLPIEADIQNFLAFKSERQTDNRYRGDEYRDNLIQVLNMYIQVPRTLYRVTIMSPSGEKTSTIVDETYKPIYKPVYVKGKPKKEEFLLEGEHVEATYINELWRVIKLNFTRDPNPRLNYDVWVKLEKYPVQLSNPRIGRYGSLIPVNGGPTTNKYSSSHQIVDKAASWQILYNYLWNRIRQILETEIGPFFVMNQNAIPTESLDGSWGKNNILKFLLTARDTGFAPVDTSPGNMGGMSQLTGGFGQKVDMSRTSELIEKVQLAETIKNECFSVIGVSPQFLADISPQETATGIKQGVQRSVTAIKGIYDDHYATMEKFWQTYLEVSKYIAIKGDSVEETYTNDEGERIIFQTSAAEFPLYLLGVYTSTSFDDTLLLAEMQELVKMDNTMGADLLDKVSMLSSNSIGEIHTKLKELQVSKQKQIEQQQAAEQQQVQAQIESNERLKEKELEWKREELLLKLESEENLQEMKVIGQSNFGQGTGLDDLMKLKQSELQEKDYYQSIIAKARENQVKRDEMTSRYQDSQEARNSSESIKEKELQVKREEIQARLKIAEKQLEIAKENKNPGEKKSSK